MQKIIIGITGASGVELGLKFVSTLLSHVEVFLYVVISDGAKKVLQAENHICVDSMLDSNSNCGMKLQKSIEIMQNHRTRFCIFDDSALDSPIASGSFKIDSMAITPCSTNTLAKIVCGLSDTLITRAAFVCLKEKRKLLLAPREMPFESIMLQNMLTLSQVGVIISPPILGYYANIIDLESMENFLFGKWLDSLGIENSLFQRYQGAQR